VAKQKIHSHFLQIATDKVQLLQKRLDDLKESGTNETKSTAGDKHETALAMVQIEQANIRKQLEEALAQLNFLEKLNPQIITEKITNGSLVKTNKGFFYISVALGKAMIDGVEIIALSAVSPLGKKMLGLKIGDEFELNGNSFLMESVS
jgi:transcription elongation GreA/GreB family factor